jgi:hexokinase
MNAAFFLDENKCVNLESASFDKFPKSPEGEIIDASSTQPGTALFEKEITGAYLYKHFNLIIKEKGIDFKPINSTLELKNLSHENSGEVSKIANELLDKSAAYISAQIAAISEFKKRDMVFVMDGSFFWESTYKKKS